jgi:ATP-dependent Clp protease ATP-binding subunit ClpA
LLARKESDRLHHNYIGTEHVLLGLIALGKGVAVNVLSGLGLNLENIRTEVEKHTGIGPVENSAARAPYTPRVKKVLDLARREAKNLGHTYIGTEHLLLGLLRDGDNIAAQILRNLSVNLEQTRSGILRELDPNFNSKNAIALEVGNLGNFTPRAIQALSLAREEADRLHQNAIGTDHLLLGIIKLEQGVAVNLLKSLGLDFDSIRAEVEKRACPISDEKFTGTTLYTPRTKRVLEMAKEEAKVLNYRYIGIEHLSLGLLRENEGPAAEIFKHLEVDVEVARKKILDELNPLSS